MNCRLTIETGCVGILKRCKIAISSVNAWQHVHGKHHLQRRHGHDEEGHQMDRSMAAHCGIK
jgi:hypothetical protein